MADISASWGDLLALVRQCEGGQPLSEPGRQAALQLAVSVGLATVPGAVGCSISLRQPDGGFVTPAAAGPVSILLDDLQYAQGDGPCLRAARTGQAQRLDSFAAAEPDWPEFVRQGLTNGVASSLSLPLLTATMPAALNVYGKAENVFGSARATAVAGVTARATSALLMDAGGTAIQELSAARILREVGKRTLISRAQGVLMEREGLPAEPAYHHLAVRSKVDSQPIWEVARRLLESEAARQEALTGRESEAGSASSAGEDVSA